MTSIADKVIVAEFFRAGDKDYTPRDFIQALREGIDNTRAANVAAAAEPATAIIPLAALAWSQDDEPSAATQKAAQEATPGPRRQPWSKAWLMAVVILIGAAVVALAIVALSPPAAADPTGDPGNVGTLAPPPSKASTATLDDQFLAQIARWGMRVADVRAAIAGAHETCSFLAAGHNAQDVIEQGMRVNHTMTRDDEISFYNAAVGVYCPKYLRISGAIA